MKRSLTGLAALFMACAAEAGLYPVDDSASLVLDPKLRMEWASVAPRAGGSLDVVGQTTVVVRLDVSPWLGQSGRVFMTLPPRAASPIEARWTTRGRLQPGSVRSGERAMVFTGPIGSSVLEDTLVIRISTHGEMLEQTELLEFGFEIEVEE